MNNIEYYAKSLTSLCTCMQLHNYTTDMCMPLAEGSACKHCTLFGKMFFAKQEIALNRLNTK